MFVAFEGVNGGGKSSLLAAVAAELSSRRVRVAVVDEFPPSFLDDAIGSLRRREPYLKLHPTRRTAVSQTLLLASLFAYKIEALTQSALQEGAVVLMDRYLDSLSAYQVQILVDAGVCDEGAARSWIANCTEYLPRPDLTVFVRPPLQVIFARLASRGEPVTGDTEAFLALLADRFDQSILARGAPVCVAENIRAVDESALLVVDDILKARSIMQG